MASVMVEEVFLTEPNPYRVGPSPETIDIENIIVDNLTTTDETVVNLTVTGSFTGIGVVNSVTGSTGINITGTASNPVVNIANTTVTPASYEIADITVDAQGRITAAATGAVRHSSDFDGDGTTASNLALVERATVANDIRYVGAYLQFNSRGIATRYSNVTGLGVQPDNFFAQVQNIATGAGLITVLANNLNPNYSNLIGTAAAGFASGTGLFTAPYTGWYYISASVQWNANATGIRRLLIEAQQVGGGGATFYTVASACDTGNATQGPYQSVSVVINFTANQQARIRCAQTSGITLNSTEFFVSSIVLRALA